jgi:hypothetical protein
VIRIEAAVVALRDGAEALVAGQAHAPGVVFLRHDLVVGQEVAAADGELLHADQDFVVFDFRGRDVQELELPGSGKARCLHAFLLGVSLVAAGRRPL